MEIPWESTPRRSVSTIMSAVVWAWGALMPQAPSTETSCRCRVSGFTWMGNGDQTVSGAPRGRAERRVEHAASLLGDTDGGAEETLRGGRAQRHHQLGLHQVQLGLE